MLLPQRCIYSIFSYSCRQFMTAVRSFRSWYPKLIKFPSDKPHPEKSKQTRAMSLLRRLGIILRASSRQLQFPCRQITQGSARSSIASGRNMEHSMINPNELMSRKSHRVTIFPHTMNLRGPISLYLYIYRGGRIMDFHTFLYASKLSNIFILNFQMNYNMIYSTLY